MKVKYMSEISTGSRRKWEKNREIITGSERGRKEEENEENNQEKEF